MTTLVVPPRSRDQRMSALGEANRIRVYRGKLKQRLAARKADPVKVLSDPDCATMKVVDLLCALPKMGPHRAAKILRAASISPSKHINGLSYRQRTELVTRLREWKAKRPQ